MLFLKQIGQISQFLFFDVELMIISELQSSQMNFLIIFILRNPYRKFKWLIIIDIMVFYVY